MRLVLLGDIHLYHLAIGPWKLLTKRLLGQTNLWIRRRVRFDAAWVEQAIARIAQRPPDSALCCGDLTTTALPAEFASAMELLRPLLDTTHAFVVPGNHDRYTFASTRTARFERAVAPYTAERWPYSRRLGTGLHLLAVDATRPNWFSDRGHLGTEQLQRLGRLLAAIPREDRVILLCHYTLGTPPGQRREPRSHRMIDEASLATLLNDAGHRVLYVHGHVHRPWCWRPPAAPNVLAVNAGAPGMTTRRFPRGQGYWEVEAAPTGVDDDASDANWALVHHRPTAAGEWLTEPIKTPTEPGRAVFPGGESR